jgi:hypothetical protein
MQEVFRKLEEKYAAIARKEIKARERRGLPVTPEFLNGLEKKYMVMAIKEIEQYCQER